MNENKNFTMPFLFVDRINKLFNQTTQGLYGRSDTIIMEQYVYHRVL